MKPITFRSPETTLPGQVINRNKNVHVKGKYLKMTSRIVIARRHAVDRRS